MPMPQQQQQSIPQQIPVGLNGKIVDGADMVRATEVPIGSYGIFPKADLSEIYIKSWNNNGTTSIITFIPVPSEAPVEVQQQDNTIIEILNKINNLEVKIDSLSNHNNSITTTETIKRKESKANEY